MPGVEEEVPGVVMPEVVAGVVAGEAGVVVAKVARVGAGVVPGELPERLGEGKEGSSRGAPPPQPQFPTRPSPGSRGGKTKQLQEQRTQELKRESSVERIARMRPGK